MTLWSFLKWLLLDVILILLWFFVFYLRQRFLAERHWQRISGIRTWTYGRGRTLFLPDISANVVKSEIKIAHWFFVRDRERNWRSSGGEACVATKDDNNINVLPTRSSSRQQKKASESEQLSELLSSWTQSERFPNTCRTSLPGPTGLPDKRVHSRKFYEGSGFLRILSRDTAKSISASRCLSVHLLCVRLYPFVIEPRRHKNYTRHYK